MNCRVWNKIKKQLLFAKEKEVALRLKRDDESKEERHLDSNVQSY